MLYFFVVVDKNKAKIASDTVYIVWRTSYNGFYLVLLIPPPSPHRREFLSRFLKWQTFLPSPPYRVKVILKASLTNWKFDQNYSLLAGISVHHRSVRSDSCRPSEKLAKHMRDEEFMACSKLCILSIYRLKHWIYLCVCEYVRSTSQQILLIHIEKCWSQWLSHFVRATM